VPLDKRPEEVQNHLHIGKKRREALAAEAAMARFTPGEMEVMRVLWKHGELKPSEIQERFGRPIKNAALRSYLTILHAKGHLARRRRGNAFYYRPKTKRETTFRSMLGDLVDIFCDGSTEALLCHLLAKESLSQEELLDLQRMAREQPASSDVPGEPSRERHAHGRPRSPDDR
jgi:predicted transcriptional regulator